jgi:hypothetical protein
MKVKPLSEALFMDQVVDLATRRGWSWLHLVKAPYKDSWRTPYRGPLGKGFPDLLLIRGSRILAVELKRDGAKPTPEQVEVLGILSGAAETACWEPKDWTEIERVLR